MKKKLALLSFITTICILLAAFGVNAFVKASSVPPSSEVTGTFQSLGQDQTGITVMTDQGEQTIPLASSVWVYRDEKKAQLSDLQPGDNLEVILNSKKQGAFVKAYDPKKTASAPADHSSQPVAPAPTQSPAASLPSSQPRTTPPPAPSPKPSASAGSESLDIKIEGNRFELELKQSPGKSQEEYEFKVKSEKGGKVYLKGEDAAVWIRQLLAAASLTGGDPKSQLLHFIAQQYGLDEKNLRMDMKGQWAANLPNAEQLDWEDSDDGNRGNGNGNGNAKGHQKQEERGKPDKKKDHGKETDDD